MKTHFEISVRVVSSDKVLFRTQAIKNPHDAVAAFASLCTHYPESRGYAVTAWKCTAPESEPMTEYDLLRLAHS